MRTENGIIRAAVIGLGGRGWAVTCNLLKESAGKVEVLSVFDPDKEVVRRAVDGWKGPCPKECGSYQEAIDVPGVDWALEAEKERYG